MLKIFSKLRFCQFELLIHSYGRNFSQGPTPWVKDNNESYRILSSTREMNKKNKFVIDNHGDKNKSNRKINAREYTRKKFNLMQTNLYFLKYTAKPNEIYNFKNNEKNIMNGFVMLFDCKYFIEKNHEDQNVFMGLYNEYNQIIIDNINNFQTVGN